jgi:polysaccharide deacetylase 2 family uncharacterized protein YibQ
LIVAAGNSRIKAASGRRNLFSAIRRAAQFASLSLAAILSQSALGAELAIVIDDVGYDLKRAERLMDLSPELTLGILPYAPHARTIAERAHERGREVILHQPMEPVDFRRLEPGTLKASMNAEAFDTQLARSLERLPGIRGVNNHTGSLLTAQRAPMERLMAGIASRGLYFLDSRTTPHTVAESIARDWSIPTIRRDVFLDHQPTEDFLGAAFERALAIANRKGHAVVIAHPYPVTVKFLEDRLAALPENVRLTRLSRLVEPVTPSDPATLALLGSPASPHISLGR